MTTINPLQPPIPLEPGERMHWGNLSGSNLGLALSSAIANAKRPVVIITPDTLTATRLEYELQFFHAATEQQPILHFPDWETLPYDQFSPHQDIISERLAALNRIPTLKQGAIVTPISTLMHRVAPRDYLAGQLFLLKAGDTFNIQTTRQQLERAGYRCVDQVREHGEFAVRGSIMDLFPMGSDTPYRIDLFDNEIDSIRTFSPETQRSQDKIASIELLPAKEFPLHEEAIDYFRQNWRSQFSGNPLNCPLYQDITEGICAPGLEYYLPFFFKHTDTLFDYLPENTLIIQLGALHPKAEEFWKDIQNRYDQRSHDVRRPILEPKQLFIPTADFFGRLKPYADITVTLEPPTETLSLTIQHKAAEPLQALKQFLDQPTGRVLFCAETAGRREVLLQLFQSIQLHPKPFASWEDFLASDERYGITIALLDDGLRLDNPPITLIAEAQLYGKRIMQRRLRKAQALDVDNAVRDLAELKIGDPVVHIDHGIGRYLGLQTLHIGDQLAEFLCLEYSRSDKLYVPVTSLHLIGRYTGADQEHAPLHKLGTEQWQRAKRKATEKVRDVAAELLEIYAKRAARPGEACTLMDGQYDGFAAAFPFEETPDQLHAIEKVIEDMQSDKPMDRLVCGDVGFGKTEVAMRAAFMAVQNNKQVAVLVPTTLLAQQHYQNFLDRFADWPIQIDVLSRFRTAKEVHAISDRLADGKVDIIIGTHRLLQDDIRFKSLGLIVIDEEHRFGVKQKERFKALRASVDILTLTATPIPRTLNMAFAGIRDLSLIATPPAKRLSIKTFVHEHDAHTTREAIQREIMRGGQVYYLHNDVATIERVARELEALVPEARPGIAHGQMRERELEQVMSDFYHRRFNLLVCTTIIESGIDVPSANTIIINRADRFGLSQLHQLRGRVGRSHHQAYAYLLVPSRKTLTGDALKRLEAIAAYEDLGIGFTLATHDLEIRGAGELLGEGQSGHMHAIGFTLYMDLLARAVEALKAGKEPELEKPLFHGPEIDLHITALIPDTYLADVHLRLQFYKRIALAKTQAELDDIHVEMIDRFGLLPQPLKNLFALGTLKLTANQLGIIKIDAHAKSGKIEFSEKPNVDPMKIIHLIQKQSLTFKLDGPTTLIFTLEAHDPAMRIEQVEHILQKLT